MAGPSAGSGGPGGGDDPHAGGPAKVVGGCAAGAGPAGLRGDRHGVLRVVGVWLGRQVAWPGWFDRRRARRVVRVWRLCSTVPDRGAHSSHRADRASVGMATHTRPAPTRWCSLTPGTVPDYRPAGLRGTAPSRRPALRCVRSPRAAGAAEGRGRRGELRTSFMSHRSVSIEEIAGWPGMPPTAPPRSPTVSVPAVVDTRLMDRRRERPRCPVSRLGRSRPHSGPAYQTR